MSFMENHLSPNVDKELLILAKGGNLSALNKIIIVFQKAIFNHLYRLTGNSEDAADLTQEAFFKMYKKRQLIDPEQNFRAWLYKLATNTAYDWFDKKKRRNEILLDGDGETNEPNLPYYHIEGLKIDLETALAKLSPKYQTIMYLYYQQGFGYEELAEIMGIPLGTVKTYLFRAKKILAEELKNYGDSLPKN